MVVVIVVVWELRFLLSVRQVAEVVGRLLPLKIRLDYLEVPCCGCLGPQASVALEEVE